MDNALAAYFRRCWTKVAHDAEDLAQDTLLKAYELLDDFPGDRPFEGWVFKIADNVGRHANRSYTRRRGMETEPLHEVEEWQEPLSEEDFTERSIARMYLEPYLQRLEPEQRLIVQRHIYEQRSWQEIADEIGIKTNAAEKRFARILTQLGKWIEEEEPGLKVRRRG